MSRRGSVWLVALLLGCGPKIESQTFAEFPALPSDQEIQVFPEDLPECPYEQVGIIASESVEATKKRASEMGAHAVIGTALAKARPTDPRKNICGTRKCVQYNTVAIRFTDPECMH
jgi:hypothetical protein